MTAGGASYGIGLPLRLGLLPWLYRLQAEGQLAFCEAALEQMFQPHPTVLDALDTLVNCGVEVRLHSVGILPGMDCDQHRHALDEVLKWCSPSLLSVHAAMSRGPSGPGESFFRPAYGAQFVDALAEHILRLKSWSHLPLAIENIASYDRQDSPADECAFLAQVCTESNVQIVFDVSNHLTTYDDVQVGDGIASLVSCLPLAHLHVSGGRHIDERYIDTHCDPIPASHLALAKHICRMAPTSVLYERDAAFEAPEVERELQSLLGLYERNLTKKV